MAINYKQRYAIDKKNRERFLAVNKNLNDNSGIYFLTRTDEEGFNYAYIGQAKHILQRLVSHLSGYQHIDLSLKKHGFYSDKNIYGWKVNFIEYSENKLDEMEQYWIKEYAIKGYQLRNKTSGSQGKGKAKIDDFKPTKGYREGIKQGMKNASKDIAYLFEKHLVVTTKDNTPNRFQKAALVKFNEFLDYYKENDNDN